MRASQFRSDPALVSQWKEMLDKHELLRLVLFDVMENEHPARMRVPSNKDEDISSTMALIELGDTRGYSKYGNGLRLLATANQEAQPMPETSYDPDEPQPKGRGRPPKQK